MINNETIKTIETMANEMANWDYGMVLCGVAQRLDRKLFRTQTPEQFEESKCGSCIDYSNYAIYKLVQMGFILVKGEPQEGQCALMIQKAVLAHNGRPCIHCIPVFNVEGRVYAIEGSWKDPSVLGLNRFISIENLQKFYVETSREVAQKHGSDMLNNHFVYIYPSFKGDLSRDEFLAQ